MRAGLRIALAGVVALCTTSALAQDGLPPIDLYKQMAEMNVPTGWVAFRDFDGQQWLYFTPVVTLHCGLEEVRYSINSDALDERFALPDCRPDMPFSLPADAGPDTIALTLPLETAQSVSVQLFFADKTESEIMAFVPCEDAGEQTCGKPLGE